MFEELIKPEKLAEILSKSDRAIIGVSGGADSMALLHVILQNRKKNNKDFKVLHINHNLHPDSGKWAQFVKDYCFKNNMPCEIANVDVSDWGNNLEQAARKARYNAFSTQNRDTVILAHHANDQLETFFLKLFRGSGVKGLRCMQDSTVSWFDKSIKLVRPLLSVTRYDIMKYIEYHSIPFIEDPSNLDLRFDRNWIRNKLLPFIQDRNEIADINILKSISIQSDTYNLMCDLAKIDLSNCEISKSELDWKKLKTLSLSRLKNLIMFICNDHNLIDVSINHVEQFANGLLTADYDSKNEMRLKNFRMYKHGKRVLIEYNHKNS